MNQGLANTLVTTLNAIELQRSEQQHNALTRAQAKVTLAIQELLQSEGVEIHKHLISRHIAEYYLGPDKYVFPEKRRLDYLRSQIQAECISGDEIMELQSYAAYLDSDDVELLQWAGVPEFPEEEG